MTTLKNNLKKMSPGAVGPQAIWPHQIWSVHTWIGKNDWQRCSEHIGTAVGSPIVQKSTAETPSSDAASLHWRIENKLSSLKRKHNQTVHHCIWLLLCRALHELGWNRNRHVRSWAVMSSFLSDSYFARLYSDGMLAFSRLYSGALSQNVSMLRPWLHLNVTKGPTY